MDRKRSPPGEDLRFSGAPGGPPERFRGRSRSPGYRRSPPPPSKRFRGEDDYQDQRYGRQGPPHRGGGGGDRFGGGPRDSGNPMTFREFMGQLPNEISPEDAKTEYDRYLAKFWGGEIRAEFEQKKNDPAVRRRFDPRVIAEAMEARNAASREAAGAYSEATAADAVARPPGPFAALPGVPTPDGEMPPGEEPLKAPLLCWDDAIVAQDLKLARQLVRKMDAEKGILQNELAPALFPPRVTEEHGAQGNDASAESNGDQQQQQKEAEEERIKAAEEAEIASDESLGPEERLAALDPLLRYLWAVHGVDYYGGREFAGLDDPSRVTARRMVRAPRPPPREEKKDTEELEAKLESAADVPMEDGTAGGAALSGGAAAGDEAAVVPAAGKEAPKDKAATDAERTLRMYEERVWRRWRGRLERGDPLATLVQADRVEREISDFVDRQVIKHDDQKWGNQLSSKLFVAREFVLKHVRNKHAHVVEAERAKILDSIFFENFKDAPDRQRRINYNPISGGFGGRGGGRGRGRGRGGGGPQGGMMMMDPSLMMGGPILVPAAGGGFQGPVIMAPMDMVMPMGMRGGGRGGRGGRGGGYGGPVVMAPQGGGQYFDLDAPKNNRAVLDYGDL